MKKVLVIAYYFPPLGMGGVRRVVNFCKYLPRFGWDPIVLTIKDIDYFAQDEDFMKEIECKIYRSELLDPLRLIHIWNKWLSLFRIGAKRKSRLGRIGKEFGNMREKYRKLSNFLFIPDNKIGWLPFGVKNGLGIIEKEMVSSRLHLTTGNIDIIFATAPPYTGLVIGYLLKKITKLPLVIEFRDPWPYFPYPTMFHRRASEWLKKKVITNSDTIITINESIRESLASIVPITHSIEVIPQGYSPDDFYNVRVQRSLRGAPTAKFTIGYIGSFIPPRTPRYFLEALSNLIISDKIHSNDIKVEIIGFCSEETETLVRKFGLQGVVEFESYRPHKYCIERMVAVDLLWIMIDETEKTASTGKIGEYLGAGKPILATIPEGPCADIVRTTKSGVVVPPRDVTAIGDAIYDFYLKYKEKRLVAIPPSAERKEYNLLNLTKRLANIFDHLI